MLYLNPNDPLAVLRRSMILESANVLEYAVSGNSYYFSSTITRLSPFMYGN